MMEHREKLTPLGSKSNLSQPTNSPNHLGRFQLVNFAALPKMDATTIASEATRCVASVWCVPESLLAIFSPSRRLKAMIGGSAIFQPSFRRERSRD
jgi:hypothetical protein